MASPSSRLRKARTSRRGVLARHSAVTVLSTSSRLIVSDLSVSDRSVSGIVILIGIVSYLLYSLSQWFKYIADWPSACYNLLVLFQTADSPATHFFFSLMHARKIRVYLSTCCQMSIVLRTISFFQAIHHPITVSCWYSSTSLFFV